MPTLSNAMSRDPSLQLLLSAANHQGTVNKSIFDDVLDKELRALTGDLGEWNSSDCLFEDVGNFLTRTTRLLALVADQLVRGREIHEYAEGKIKQMEEEHDLSELNSLIYMEAKHSSLKSMTMTLGNAAATLDSVWKDSCFVEYRDQKDGLVAVPSESTVGSSRSTPKSESESPRESDIDTFPATESSLIVPSESIPIFRQPITSILPSPGLQSPVIPLAPHPTPTIPMSMSSFTHSPTVQTPTRELDMMASNPAFQNPEEAVAYLLKNLTNRGTGKYICPHQGSCTKGGVNSDFGSLVVFERNSAFRAHLQKHEKMFKCEMPGCNAKGGFARIDQLKRHQKSVPHFLKDGSPVGSSPPLRSELLGPG